MPLQYIVLLHVQTYSCSIIIAILLVLLLTALPTRVMSTMIIIIKIYTQATWYCGSVLLNFYCRLREIPNLSKGK